MCWFLKSVSLQLYWILMNTEEVVWLRWCVSGARGISEGLVLVLLAGHLNANREVLKSWLTSGGLGYTFATTSLTTESHHVWLKHVKDYVAWPGDHFGLPHSSEKYRVRPWFWEIFGLDVWLTCCLKNVILGVSFESCTLDTFWIKREACITKEPCEDLASVFHHRILSPLLSIQILQDTIMCPTWTHTRSHRGMGLCLRRTERGLERLQPGASKHYFCTYEQFIPGTSFLLLFRL